LRQALMIRANKVGGRCRHGRRYQRVHRKSRRTALVLGAIAGSLPPKPADHPYRITGGDLCWQ
jgi:hypothetical protein